MNNESAVIFIDFEAFQHGDEPFQIKELCFLSNQASLQPLHFIFKPEIPWEKLTNAQRKTYSYEESKIHGLMWREGMDRYCPGCILHRVKKYIPHITNAVCYVLGTQKSNFLRKEFPSLKIVNYPIDSFKDMLPTPTHLTCPYRPHSRDHCALLKCYRMSYHYTSVD